MAASGNASDTTVSPLIDQLIDALNTANSSLASLDTFSILAKRQDDNEITSLVATIVEVRR